MEKLNFNKGWNFTFENDIEEFNVYGFDKYSDAAGAPARFYSDNNWEKVDLPHDWTLSLGKTPLAYQSSGGYPNSHYHRYHPNRRSDASEIYSVGWYRKEFSIDPEWKDKRVWIEFEGVFRDAIIWVNGVYLDRHTSGYTSFTLELTDHLVFGEVNSVAVRVDCDQAEGWWYEGGGIYRNVNLLICEPVYFAHGKTVIKTELNGDISVSAQILNDTEEACSETVHFEIFNADGKAVAHTEAKIVAQPFDHTEVNADLKIDSPHLWNLESPYRYKLSAKIEQERIEIPFGVRTVAFDADRGFLLNGIPTKIRGACNHHDFGGVGVALTDNLNEYKIRRLKDMGVNAYRSSHNAPSPALLDACDKLGMLVMDETRMFGTSPEAVKQLTDLIERDRNHPCVFIWSLGNEEFSVQNLEWSRRLMEKMTRLAKKLDPTRPVTYGGNNGMNFTGANASSEVRGVNYVRNGKGGDWLAQYHEQHPNQPIIGTEEASYVLSRGGACNDLGNGLLNSFGDVTMTWGSTPKGWVKYFEERNYLAGSFMWTGFDYRGEPNPFVYTHNVSSFGTIDLCGMEKPPFYYYKAWWTDEPVLKLAPHWNHEVGQTVKIAAFTNCESIKLFRNGKFIEEKTVTPFDAPVFTVEYEPGTLTAEGIKNGEIIKDELRTSDTVNTVKVSPVLTAKSDADTAIYEIEALDKNGIFCPLASDEIALEIQNGSIVGVCNGDPANWDREQFKPHEKSRPIRIFQSDIGTYIVPPKAPNVPTERADCIEYEEAGNGFEDDYRLVARYRYRTKEVHDVTFTSLIQDASEYEYIEFERLGSKSEIYLNGEKLGDTLTVVGEQSSNSNRPFRFYCKFNDEKNELQIISHRYDTDPPAISGYIKIGRQIQPHSSVKLHYGKARVFVRSETPNEVVLKAKISDK